MNNTFYIPYLRDETVINNLPYQCEYLILYEPSLDLSIKRNLNLPVLLKNIIISADKSIFKNIKMFWKIPFGCKITGINRLNIKGMYKHCINFDENINMHPRSIIVSKECCFNKYIKLDIENDEFGKKYFLVKFYE